VATLNRDGSPHLHALVRDPRAHRVETFEVAEDREPEARPRIAVLVEDGDVYNEARRLHQQPRRAHHDSPTTCSATRSR
jgi:hypothetical protein